MMSTVSSAPSVARAIELHQAGSVAEAALAYERLIAQNPGNDLAHYLLGMIRLAEGDLTGSLRLLTRAVELNPGVAAFHANRALVLRRVGHAHAARESYEAALALDPGLTEAHNNLGLIFEEAGDNVRARQCYEEAARLAPRSAEAHFNIGNIQAKAGCFVEAERSFRRAAELRPEYVKAFHNLGNALVQQGRHADAVPAFRTAVRLAPHRPEATMQLGLCLAAMGRPDEAAETLLGPVLRYRSVERTDNLDWTTFTRATPTKLVHDLEQLDYLDGRGLLPRRYKGLRAEYRELIRRTEGREATGFDVRDVISERLRHHYNRFLYNHPAPPLPGGTINRDVRGEEIEDAFIEAGGVVYIDDFLEPAALHSLREYALLSTIWFQSDFVNELSSTIFNGFACPLIFQIANDIRSRFPRLLGHLALTSAWAYKYYGDKSGVGVHADAGQVSVNLWLTPDELNASPETGGLTVWNVEVPHQYLGKPDDVQQVIVADVMRRPGLRATYIPYRYNRAAMFVSTKAHGTDRYQFLDTYEGRRVNMTLLFGHPGASA